MVVKQEIFRFSEYCNIAFCLGVKQLGPTVMERLATVLNVFPVFANNHSHYCILDFKVFGNNLITLNWLMGQKQLFL